MSSTSAPFTRDALPRARAWLRGRGQAHHLSSDSHQLLNEAPRSPQTGPNTNLLRGRASDFRGGAASAPSFIGNIGHEPRAAESRSLIKPRGSHPAGMCERVYAEKRHSPSERSRRSRPCRPRISPGRRAPSDRTAFEAQSRSEREACGSKLLSPASPGKYPRQGNKNTGAQPRIERPRCQSR